MTNLPLRCPVCREPMVRVDARGHYGTKIPVETCPACRGFWLDAIEPVSLGHQAVVDLEGDADFAEIQTAPRDDYRPCPVCNVALHESTGGGLPEGLRVDACPTCRGMWFDRGELLVYKSALEAKRKHNQQDELERVRERAFRRQPQAKPALGGLGARISPWSGAAPAIAALLDLLDKP